MNTGDLTRLGWLRWRGRGDDAGVSVFRDDQAGTILVHADGPTGGTVTLCTTAGALAVARQLVAWAEARTVTSAAVLAGTPALLGPAEPAPCCPLHVAGGCCDPADCGPCCDRCPTCPTLHPELRASGSTDPAIPAPTPAPTTPED